MIRLTGEQAITGNVNYYYLPTVLKHLELYVSSCKPMKIISGAALLYSVLALLLRVYFERSVSGLMAHSVIQLCTVLQMMNGRSRKKN